MKRVNQGAVVRLTATFKNFAGTLTDPTVVTFFVQSRGDNEWSEYIYDGVNSIVRSGTGVYYFEQDTSDEAGRYNWRIISSGLAPGSRQGSFYVVPMDPNDDSSEFSS